MVLRTGGDVPLMMDCRVAKATVYHLCKLVLRVHMQ